MKKFFLYFLLVYCLFLPSNLFSETISKIEINGNNRISSKTILDNINIKKNKDYTESDLNLIYKKLFSTNFFKSINLNLNNNILKINIEENPLINFFYLKGIKNETRENFLYDNLNLGQNKIFSNSQLKSDIEKIKSTFSSAGYFNIDVIPQISLLKDNTVNIVLFVNRGEKYKINRIFFIGNKNFSSSDLNDVVFSSEHGWWKFLSNSTTVNEVLIDYDKKLLKDFYLNNGYYDIQIFASDIEVLNDRSANISYSINSGNKYFFDKYSLIDDEKHLKEFQFKELSKSLNKKLNGNYSKEKINNAYDLINDYLNVNKIEFVKINIKEKKLTETNKIKLELILTKTKSKYVKNINIKGNSITNENVVRRNLIFSEGDSLIDYKIVKSINNLKNLRIFKDVTYELKHDPDNKELTDIIISVVEQPTGSISAGVGVTNSGTSVSTGIQEQNFLGEGIKLNADLSLGTEKISGVVGLILPDFKNTGNDLGYDVYIRSLDYKNAGYKSKVVGNSISTRYEIYEDVTFKTGLAADIDQIDANSSASALYKAREGDFLTYKTFYNLGFDKRDSKVKPTKGVRTGFGQALAIPGSDIPYLENNVFGSFYSPLSKSFILNIKGGVSSINSLNSEDVKLSDRKFLSNKKLRGFESLGIGPKDGKDHVGGNYSAYTSISSTIPNPLPEKLNASSILFLDAGNVWGVDYDNSKDSDKIRSSAGIALDWISPLGPLSFVLAQTLSSADGDLEESFSFNIGSSF